MRRQFPCVIACAALWLTACAPGQPSGSSAQSGARRGAATLPDAAAPADDRRTNNRDLDHPALRPQAVPGEVLVKFRAKANPAEAIRKSGVQRLQAYKALPGLTRVRISKGTRLQSVLETLRAMPEVEYAEPNYLLSKRATPNDPRFAEQWPLNNTGQTGGSTDYDINAPEGWELRNDAADVVIAVIDTGIDYNHEDLAANIWVNTAECVPNGIDDDGNGYVDDCHGIDTANHDSDPMDDEGHGTHVAGIIGAVGNNGIGIAGVAWSVQLLPCKFLGGSGEGSTADAIACLDYVAALKDRGVNIVATNNSWGGYSDSQALRDAVAVQRDKGILFVTAAGNDGINVDRLPEYPCSIDLVNILCVGGFPPHGPWNPANNYGEFTVHLTAPSDSVLSTLPGNQYGLESGTSMAAPHVTGILALLAADDPARPWLQTRNLMLSSGYFQSGYETVVGTITGRRPRIDTALNCSDQVTKARLAPRFYNKQVHRIGVPIDLAVLHLKCGQPNGDVTVGIAPDGLTLTLHDNGTGADRLAGDGVYSARWTPMTPGARTITYGVSNANSISVVVDEHIKPGFPVQQLNLAGTYSLPIYMSVGNIAGDARPEIITTSLAQGPVYVWNGDGTPTSGWPIKDENEAIVTRGVAYTALAELDGDSTRSELAAAYWFGDVFAYGPNASVLPGWPTRTISRQEVADPTVAGDIDGDGRDEIFVYDLGTELIYRHDGTRMPGWEPINSGIPNIVDLDGDGINEIVTATVPLQNIPTVINAWHADGAALPGFPVDAGVIAGGTTMVGDVDGDGHNEILVIANYGSIRKVSDTGQISVLIPPVEENFLHTVAALADLDGDGIPEIVMVGDGGRTPGYSSSFVYAFKGNGTLLPGFPFDMGGYRTIGDFTPVIGDVDGDRQPDIIFGAADIFGTQLGEIWAINRTGSVLSGFPKQVYAGYGAAPALADLDLNGRNDIIINGDCVDCGAMQDNLWVYEIPGPGPHGPIEWGQYQGDAKHQGYYELGKNLPAHAFLSTRVRGSGRISATGIDCGTDCVERYAKGTNVTLTASGSGGHAFSGWLGACAGRGNPCTVAVNRYTSVVAVFDNSATRHRLSLTTSGTGIGVVASAPAGISCPADCSEDFYPDATVTLTATAGADSHFSEWTGCPNATGHICKITMAAAKTVGVAFDLNSRIEMVINGAGSVTSTPAGIDCGTVCRWWFATGSQVVLTAHPQAGSVFYGWGGACSGSANPCTVTMNDVQNLSATFAPTIAVNVALAGGGAGAVTSTPAGIDCGADCSGDYLSNTHLVLHAEAAAGSRFTGWSGACTQASGDCIFDVGAPANVTANFVLRHALTVTTTAGGSVSSDIAVINCGATCTESYDADTAVVLTAQATAGNKFSGWTGACSGTTLTCTVTMSQARTVGASFAVIPPPPPANSGGGGKGGGGGRIDLGLLVLGALALMVRLRSLRARQVRARR